MRHGSPSRMLSCCWLDGWGSPRLGGERWRGWGKVDDWGTAEPKSGKNCYSSEVHITFICRNRTRQVDLFTERENDPLTMCATVCVTDARRPNHSTLGLEELSLCCFSSSYGVWHKQWHWFFLESPFCLHTGLWNTAEEDNSDLGML